MKETMPIFHIVSLSSCSVCQASVWSYDMKEHYAIRHPEFNEVPELVSPEEMKQMKRKKV